MLFREDPVDQRLVDGSSSNAWSIHAALGQGKHGRQTATDKLTTYGDRRSVFEKASGTMNSSSGNEMLENPVVTTEDIVNACRILVLRRKTIIDLHDRGRRSRA